jgi:hypothetical protein
MDRRSEAQRRESFPQMNESCAIEGMVMTGEDLALQERVIRGALTRAAAITAARNAFGMESASLETGSMPAPRVVADGAKSGRDYGGKSSPTSLLIELKTSW